MRLNAINLVGTIFALKFAYLLQKEDLPQEKKDICLSCAYVSETI